MVNEWEICILRVCGFRKVYNTNGRHVLWQMVRVHVVGVKVLKSV